MRSGHGRFRPQFHRTVLFVLLCIALLLFAVTIQVVHTHPDGTFHRGCSLCVAAHAAIAIIVSVALILLLQGAVRLFAQRQRTTSCFLIAFAFFIRPPPASALLS